MSYIAYNVNTFSFQVPSRFERCIHVSKSFWFAWKHLATRGIGEVSKSEFSKGATDCWEGKVYTNIYVTESLLSAEICLQLAVIFCVVQPGLL